MINYQNIQDSIEYFQMNGYKRIETPWTVTDAVSALTKPKDREDWKISNKNKVLVASAEQGFLYMALKGFLAEGKFQSVSPCFRDEAFDLTHTKYFIKNELIITEKSYVFDVALEKMVDDAMDFFGRKLVTQKEWEEGKLLIKKKTGDYSYDIEYKGIELGSYGIRETEILTYVYGTACAEPRLSYCQNLKINEQLRVSLEKDKKRGSR